MAKVVKRRVRWTASASTDVVGYKVYWSLEADGDPDYGSPNVQVSSNQIIIPDDAPEFPEEEGVYVIGITAVDDVGNESDMVTATAPFDFLVPDSVSNVVIENV
jgi:hypothetical protein